MDAASLTRRLLPIPEGPQRAAWLARELTALPVPEAAELLAGMLDRAAQGTGREAWLALAFAICKRSFNYAWIQAVYAETVARGGAALRPVLLAGDTARESAGEGDFPPPDAALDGLALGQRKALCRGARVELLEKLAADGDPAVIRIWLSNPRVTERLVVRLVAARPNRAAVLAAVAAEWKWLSRAAVRSALAANPYSPAQVAAAIVPTLPFAEVRALARDARVHPLVSEVASTLTRPGAPGSTLRDTRP